ncbi:MAG TPA: hypothetical protein VET23_13100, partial [Chitinophagaceae bacterium]|nr:hypothetical protein [Chitinophagaceae bacterium]
MKFFLTLLIFVSTNFSFAQINTPEIVNNKTIIQLQKAGLSKAVIISKINSSVCSFDLSTDQLIGLKKAGIADEVIDAMLKKSSSSSAGNNENTNIKADSVKVLPSGIYYCKGQPCELVELEPSVYSQAKSGSGILTALTYGIAKTKQKATLSGAKANLQIEDSLPYFYFYFDRAQGGNLNNSSNIMWFSTATSPNEFILVNFTIESNKKSREVVTGSWN